MLKNIHLFYIGFSLCVTATIQAAQTTADTVRSVNIEQVNKIAGKLIAPCCWKQTVDVHPSSASDKIKAEIEAALIKGQTEEQIIERFVAEYGERILATPKPTGFNLSLWILPGLILLGGSLVLVVYLRHVSKSKADKNAVQPPSIDESELKRVEKELHEMDN